MSMNRTCPISNFTSEEDSVGIRVSYYRKTRDLTSLFRPKVSSRTTTGYPARVRPNRNRSFNRGFRELTRIVSEGACSQNNFISCFRAGFYNALPLKTRVFEVD